MDRSTLNDRLPAGPLLRAWHRAPAQGRSGAAGRSGLLAVALAGLLGLGAPLSQAADAASAPAAAASAPTLRPEVATPLIAAQTQLKANNPQQALVHVGEAEQVADLSPYESHVLRRLKSTALLAQGEQAAALPLFESLIEDPLLPPADRRIMTETTIKLALQLKDYPLAARWMKPYLAGDQPNAEIQRLYPQVLYASGDFAGAASGLRARADAELAAGRQPDEATLRMLASSLAKVDDSAGYLTALRQLATTTAKPEYWKELVQRVALTQGFDNEALRLDLYRLRRAMGEALSADELSDMAYRARRAGLPGESQAVLEQGFASGRLGSHANAAADRQLQTDVTKAAAGDRAAAADTKALAADASGKALFGLGFSLVGGGDSTRGLALMQQGLAKGGLPEPELARLHLGVAQFWAGQTDAARQTLAGVQGGRGVGELARLWTDWLASGAPRATGR